MKYLCVAIDCSIHADVEAHFYDFFPCVEMDEFLCREVKYGRFVLFLRKKVLTLHGKTIFPSAFFLEHEHNILYIYYTLHNSDDGDIRVERLDAAS